MPVESIKLSPKKNGNGYASSYSVSISNKEVQECGLMGKRIIKISDKECAQIIIKSKQFTVTLDMLHRIAELKEKEKIESENIDGVYFADKSIRTFSEAVNRFADEQTGMIKRPAYHQLEKYLLSLSMENIVDLTLMMYMGREIDCDMNMDPGEDRFLEFYDRYGYIVHGKSKEDLVSLILEKMSMVMHLRKGYRLLTAPKGSSLDSVFNKWDEM